jgi:hypothetical protein
VMPRQQLPALVICSKKKWIPDPQSGGGYKPATQPDYRTM